MAPRLKVESRRLLTAFSANLTRLDPQPLDWQRFYDFILYAFGHEPPSAEAVGHALVQNGLDWDKAEPFMLFYKHGGRTSPAAGYAGAEGTTRETTAARSPLMKHGALGGLYGASPTQRKVGIGPPRRYQPLCW